MVYSPKWITQKGKLTQENRDFCAVALCGNKAIYVVVDGSTKGSQSGVLACEYSKALADQFVINAGFDTAAQLSALVNALSDKFKTIYPEGRLSFLVLLDAGNAAFYAIHAGDCRLGQVGLGNKIEWLSRPHTLANAVEDISDECLAKHESRHTITRSFRPGRICEVEITPGPMPRQDKLIIATDGYWADLDTEKQAHFTNGVSRIQITPLDDTSCLLLSNSPNTSDCCISIEGDDNFYLIKK